MTDEDLVILRDETICLALDNNASQIDAKTCGRKALIRALMADGMSNHDAVYKVLELKDVNDSPGIYGDGQ